MNSNLLNLLICPNCDSSNIDFNNFSFDCLDCVNSFPIKNNIPRFVSDNYHSNFGYQWNEFSKVQLDSYNGANLSETRLLNQSGMKVEDFFGKKILEIGAGNGRFTEVLLKYGARVVAVDYSIAIDANYENNYSKDNDVIFLQADLFDLPLKENSFDIVICYGVIQHTGNNEMALLELCKFPVKGGILLVDIYSNGLRHFNPWIYLIRPFFSLIKTSDKKRLAIVKRFVNIIFPLQVKILRWLHNRSGFFKFCHYVVNRSPNSVYGINLYLDGKINLELARDWSIMDTFDGWAPKHDHPISKAKWFNMLDKVVLEKNFLIETVGQSGQGHIASLIKK
jgi:2-polyprenyl-3-methyl-5-hydroxy-6-metoxy-1,4-benzoquinol methylase